MNYLPLMNIYPDLIFYLTVYFRRFSYLYSFEFIYFLADSSG
jgi:hypothetical protein